MAAGAGAYRRAMRRGAVFAVAGSGSLARRGVYRQRSDSGARSAADDGGGCCPAERSTSRRGRLERVCRAAAGQPAAGVGTVRVLPGGSGHAARDGRGRRHRGDLVGDPRRAARIAAARPNNKILWVSRIPLAAPDPLIIRATLAGSTRTATVSVPGGPGPSIIDLPAPGCWTFHLSWAGHTDELQLRYVA